METRSLGPKAPPLRVAAVIPTYNNAATIRPVVLRIREHLDQVLVVDDGSGPSARQACADLALEGLSRVVHRKENGGKGAAVKTGLTELARLGFTHAFQVDADGQHTIEDMPAFIDAAQRHPGALILGSPRYDETAPAARLIGRKLTRFWTHVETFGRIVEDPMCGFRVYPIQAALRAAAWGNAMDFDPEIVVNMAWHGTPILNLPTQVRYLSKEEGGVSHFRLWRDNALISWMHTRLMFSLFFRLLRFKPLPRRLTV